MTTFLTVLASYGFLFGQLAIEPSAVLFENDIVKVHRALDQVQGPGSFHDHPRNRVMIYLQSGEQRFTYQDGRPPSILTFKAGEVKWSPSEAMHSTETTKGPVNIVEVELKQQGSGTAITSDLDPVKLDPAHYRVDFENPQVRVLRARIEGGGIAPRHEHSVNRVTVFLTDQNFQVTDESGKVSRVKHKAGEAIWGTPTIHKEENLSHDPFEVIAVELKN